MDGIALNQSTLNLPVESAPHLQERYDRFMEALSSEHPGDICDEAKALLECVFRTIIMNRNGEVDEGVNGHASFIILFEQAWDTLNSGSAEFKPALKKIIEVIGNSRNNYGAVSHGQDGYDTRSIGMIEATYLARSTLVAVGYMYNHHLNVSRDMRNARINYADNTEFNDYLDSEDALDVAGIKLQPSEALFNTDIIAYKDKLVEFMELRISEQYESDLNAMSDYAGEMQRDINNGH